MASNEQIQERGKRLAAILGPKIEIVHTDEQLSDFEALKEFRRTQPALYDAITAYGTALIRSESDRAFEAAGEVARQALALAARLPG